MKKKVRENESKGGESYFQEDIKKKVDWNKKGKEQGRIKQKWEMNTWKMKYFKMKKKLN